MANPTPAVVTAAALLVGAAAVYFSLRESPQAVVPAAPTPEQQVPAQQEPDPAPAMVKVDVPWTEHDDQRELTNKPSPVPLHRLSRHKPYSWIPVTSLPGVRDGIRLPDGRRIPFLNGITAAPELQRDPEHGPVPDVVGLMVDGEGFEWWLHADNSVTTTRYKRVTALGHTYWDVATEHAVPSPERNLRTLDLAPPGDSGAGKGR